MWTRVKVDASRRLREFLGGAGTPRVSLPLALVAGAFLVADAVGGGGEDRTLAGTWPWWTLAALLVADASVSVLRGLPLRQSAEGHLSLASIRRGALPGIALRLAWLAAALAFLSSTAYRDRLVFRVAEGERFTAGPDQLVRRDPLRPLSGNPPAAALEVEGVRGGGAVGASARLVGDGGATKAVCGVFPAWLGSNTYARAVRTGVAVRYELSTGGSSPLDGAFAKLSPDEPGGAAFIRSEGTPYRIRVEVPDAGALERGAPPTLGVAVFRGKLVVAEGQVRDGAPLHFEGQALRFPEWRPWVELELVRDPGLALAAAAALLALGSGVLERSRRRAADRRGEGQGG